jgi:predicted nucleic acid-binding protein
MSVRGPVALLDANVLYSAPVRDLLLTLAAADLLVPHWSDEIHNEWIRNLLQARPDITPQMLARTRAAMDAAFPEALVQRYDWRIPSLHLPDPGDLHVLAAAIEARAQAIITFNLRDFPPSILRTHGLVAVHPDTFVVELLRHEPQRIRDAIASRRRTLKNPPLSADEFRASPAGCDLRETSLRLRDFDI